MSKKYLYNFYLTIRHSAVSMAKLHPRVVDFQLFAVHFRGKYKVRKIRERKNAKGAKCIAQRIPAQLRSFPTEIFPANSRRSTRSHFTQVSGAYLLQVSTTTFLKRRDCAKCTIDAYG